MKFASDFQVTQTQMKAETFSRSPQSFSLKTFISGIFFINPIFEKISGKFISKGQKINFYHLEIIILETHINLYHSLG